MTRAAAPSLKRRANMQAATVRLLTYFSLRRTSKLILSVLATERIFMAFNPESGYVVHHLPRSNGTATSCASTCPRSAGRCSSVRGCRALFPGAQREAQGAHDFLVEEQRRLTRDPSKEKHLLVLIKHIGGCQGTNVLGSARIS
ncbi:unnamed protein product [Prorocentrum cordatum]|uniref:Uncharacterized protein n=1 Tax=Prorocentrum cordatum TaxID=2364126 RepID=A0ABN9VYY2_9DINO|nr:unnamed protein product [Polarella glacialis]